MINPIPREQNIEESQVICLDNICKVDGSWTSTTQLSGCHWVWMDSLENIQFIGTRNLRQRETSLHSEMEVLRQAMESMLQHLSCQSLGTNCKDLIAMIKEPHAWQSNAAKLEAIKTLLICFPDVKISHIPRAQNGISDSLAKTTRCFYRELCYFGCSVPVWLPRPPQV